MSAVVTTVLLFLLVVSLPVMGAVLFAPFILGAFLLALVGVLEVSTTARCGSTTPSSIRVVGATACDVGPTTRRHPASRRQAAARRSDALAVSAMVFFIDAHQDVQRREHLPQVGLGGEVAVPDDRESQRVDSWLLDLTAAALLESPALEGFAGRFSDSGEGRWTILAAVDQGVPAHVLSVALYERFSSRDEAELRRPPALSAMRKQFGGHAQLPRAEAA